MVRVRQALRKIVFTWCLCQAIGLFVPPIVILAGAELLECTCAHDGHAVCPMHHARTAERQCVMDSADEGAGNTPASVPGLSDLMIMAVSAIARDTARSGSRWYEARILFRPIPPDLRPPRL